MTPIITPNGILTKNFQLLKIGFSYKLNKLDENGQINLTIQLGEEAAKNLFGNAEKLDEMAAKYFN